MNALLEYINGIFFDVFSYLAIMLKLIIETHLAGLYWEYVVHSHLCSWLQHN